MEKPAPERESNRLTQLLDQALGHDRFDRGPVPLEDLMFDYSSQVAPKSAIKKIQGAPLPGCVGALVLGDDQSSWGVLYRDGLSPGRQRYTLAHEFGHWMLHRSLLGDSIFCGEDDVFRRKGEGIEREADVFSANLLMPFHDFRKTLPPTERPDFKRLSDLASRYGVSLTAAILRWLEYTETRAIMIVSTDGFAAWAKASQPAFRSGRFIRTRGTPFELPEASIAASSTYDDPASSRGIEQARGVWFDEPVVEMSIRADTWDREITIIHLDRNAPVHHMEEPEEDILDKFA